MKLFENKKTKNIRTINFLNFSVYTCEKSPNYKSQNFLNGVLKTETILKKEDWEKTIKVLGFPIAKRIDEIFFRKRHIFNFLIKTEDLRKTFIKNYSKYINKKHDDIYILNSNSGETYLFLTHITDVINKNKSKNPLILAQKKYHISLIKMLCPDVPYAYTGHLKNVMPCQKFEIEGQRFFTIYPPQHFVKLEEDIHKDPNGTVNYYDRILESSELNKETCHANIPSVSKKTTEDMLEKVKGTGLNLDNFIFISPEAASNPTLSSSFWNELTIELQKKGYDLFFNTLCFETNLKLKTCFLNFEEVYALAQKSKGIISLRNGLVEPLTTIKNIPVVCFYTGFFERGALKPMPAGKVLGAFSLKSLQNVDIENIFEYDMENTLEDEALNKILRIF